MSVLGKGTFGRARLPVAPALEPERFEGFESEDFLEEGITVRLGFLQSIAISSTRAVPVDFLDDLKVACHDLRASSERRMWKQKMKNPCRVFKMAKMY